jgi:hypothetical protein
MSDLWRWCRGGAATTVVEWLVGVGAEDKEARVTLRDGILGVADECTVYGGEEKVTDF